MNEIAASSRARKDWRRGRSEAIQSFLAEYASSENDDLLFQMLVTVCRLAADRCDRGDLKVLNAALKELRYAFKVFAPYAEVSKVSIFGSSRTDEQHPQYLEAKKFAELIQQRMGTDCEIQFRPLPQDDPKQRCPDITKARTVLGWQPRVSLEEGLGKTIEYFRSKELAPQTARP